MKDSIKVKLKTGFFAKTEYILRIGKNGLCFSPFRSGGEKFVISAAEKTSVTLAGPKLKMEILVAGRLYVADISNDADFQKTMKILKENIDAKIVMELN